MGTGATDPQFLLIQWSSPRAQVARGRGRAITCLEEVDAPDGEALSRHFADWKSQGAEADVVIYSPRFTDFSVVPADLALSMEAEAMAMQFGPSQEKSAVRTFEGVGVNGNWQVLERQANAIESSLLRHFPHAEVDSANFRYIQAVLRQEASGGSASSSTGREVIYIDTDGSRALLVWASKGALKWAVTTSEVAGDGLLYACVNALHRGGVSPEEVHVCISGTPANEGASFERFFLKVEVHHGFRSFIHASDGVEHTAWVSLLNMHGCVS